MTDYTTHMSFPLPSGCLSGQTSRIRRAIHDVDQREDISDQETGRAFALLAISRVWAAGCSCSQCQDEYLHAVRLLLSEKE